MEEEQALLHSIRLYNMSLKFKAKMDPKLLFSLLTEQKAIYSSSQKLKLSKKPILNLNATFQLIELKMKDGLDSLGLLMKKNSRK